MLFCNECHNFYDEAYEKIHMQITRNDGDLYIRHLHKLSDKPECGACKDNLIEVDDEIVPMLSALWEKGYETLFSCSGHSNAAYAKPKYYDLNTYVLIDVSKFTDDFINKILHIANEDYKANVFAELTYSSYNNNKIKCISFRRQKNGLPEIFEFERAAIGYDSIPPCNEVVSLHYYTLLCQVRKAMAELIEKLPVVSDADLKNSDMETGHDYSLAYNKLWVEKQLEKYPKASPDVLTFISAINYYAESTTVDNGFRSPIEKLFSNGFCYYFAVMLRDAFGGKIVEKFHDARYPHIFWMDDNNILYDIYGVYDDCDPNKCTPIEDMNEEVLSEYKHIPDM